MKISNRVAALLALVAALAPSTGCYYLHSEPVPERSNYDLDLPGLRSLARSLPGSLPSEVRIEQVAATALPGAMMMAGKSWDGVEMTHVVFQIVQADGRSIVIDSAQDREMHESMPGDDPFDDAVWQNIVQAMDEADRIVITHEHPDHVGGVARHPSPETLASSLVLTQEQLSNRDALDAVEFPASLASGLEALIYDDAIAIAPGVVLKKAPGHTPGSQMIYVLLESGDQMLFVGDVVWNLDAIVELRYRPRFITDWIIGEDRESAIHQLRALRDLHDEGEVQIIVSHDARTHGGPGIERGFRLESD